ncbi:hypothetical protein [Gemmata sp.]|uniref:hypothetical protein n=1 Tax=Gemmata sp. TaxID=1914242 RepID=UPI003F72756C
MSRRSRWTAPPPGAAHPSEPPEIIDLHPNPLPPPAAVSREETLAGVQAGFASLDDTELRLARLWLRGVAFHDVCSRLGLPEREVRALWRQMRRKLRAGLTRTD